ncbi:unnamed protein product [Urochloa decumbens]|uniref:FAS1 domain-containing protein n=1 Tax=Urochloa decumbens TaxID=240449 RepID=A0ABC9DQG9_9POAL
MRFAGILTVLLPLLLVLGAPPPCHGAGASATHNITDILAAYPNFTEFSAALTSTGAAAEINRHQTITVLAVDNAAMAQLKAQKLEPKDLERVAYLHALMDYLDADKLRHIRGGSQETSLFQAVGKAQAGEGMVSIAVSGGRVAFSLSSGGGASAFFQKSIKEVPSDIAVLQVSAPIWSPAPVAATPPPAPAPAALAPAAAPAAPGSSSSPAPAPATAPAHAPPPAPAPASSPAAADAPTPALAPVVAPAPAAIPPTPRRRPAPAPEADTPAASPDDDTDPPADEEKSNGARDTASWSFGTAVAAAAPVIFLLLW